MTYYLLLQLPYGGRNSNQILTHFCSNLLIINNLRKVLSKVCYSKKVSKNQAYTQFFLSSLVGQALPKPKACGAESAYAP